MSSPPVLQKLPLLDTPLPDFHDQLSRILNGGEYTRDKNGLEPEDIQRLVDYLDEVRCSVALPKS